MAEQREHAFANRTLAPIRFGISPRCLDVIPQNIRKA